MREKEMSSIDTVIGGKKTFTVNGDTDHHHYCKPLLVKQNTFQECANSSITTFNSSDSMAKVEARDSSTTEILENQVDTREYKLQIVWTNVVLQVLLHSSFLWEYLYLRKYPDRWETHWTLIKFNVVYALFTGLGITAGAHRLWSHRSYKAKAPLRLFLALGFASAGQNDIYEWARDHRVHHKFSETDADPHNASRGFFFSHMGWLMCKKHPDVSQKGRSVDMSDLLQDPIVVWQRKYYKWLVLILNVLFPTLFPMYYWNIPFWQCIYMSFARYAMSLHLTWLVNSAAHIHGSRPYDARIGPREQNFWKIPNFLGEMYHNYHHVFPQDYKASEYGWLGQWNLAALFIDLMAWMGQAYDLREAPKSVVTQRKERTGEYSKMYRKIERKDSDLH